MTEQIKQEAQQVSTVDAGWQSRHVRHTDIFGDTIGGITLRYKVDEIHNVAEYKFAICNPNDQYSRKLGIQIADAKEQSYNVALPPFQLDREDVVYIVLHDIFDKVPTLSRQTVSLIYNFIVQHAVRNIKAHFYPKA